MVPNNCSGGLSGAGGAAGGGACATGAGAERATGGGHDHAACGHDLRDQLVERAARDELLRIGQPRAFVADAGKHGHARDRRRGPLGCQQVQRLHAAVQGRNICLCKDRLPDLPRQRHVAAASSRPGAQLLQLAGLVERRHGVDQLQCGLVAA